MRSVVSAYATPPRAYHSFAHVQEVLRHLSTVPTWTNPTDVYLAALFHDAVYVAGRKDNETKSAELARAAIETFLPTARLDVARIVTLIELTAKHGSLTPPDAAKSSAANGRIVQHSSPTPRPASHGATSSALPRRCGAPQRPPSTKETQQHDRSPAVRTSAAIPQVVGEQFPTV